MFSLTFISRMYGIAVDACCTIWGCPKTRFLTEDEIVKDIYFNQLNAYDIEGLVHIQEKDLIGLHHTGGRWIRNHYGLWDEANPYTTPEEPEGCNHPDQMSMRIIERLWRIVNGTESI